KARWPASRAMSRRSRRPLRPFRRISTSSRRPRSRPPNPTPSPISRLLRRSDRQSASGGPARPSGLGADGHPAQHRVALDEVVAQRTEDVRAEQGGERIGEILVRILERPVQRAGGHEQRNGDVEDVLVERRAPSAGHGPTAERRGEHEEIETEMAEMGGGALPRLEVGRQRRHLVHPAPQQTQHQQSQEVVAERRVAGVMRQALGPRCEMRHPPAVTEQQQDEESAEPMQELGGPAPIVERVSHHSAGLLTAGSGAAGHATNATVRQAASPEGWPAGPRGASTAVQNAQYRFHMRRNRPYGAIPSPYGFWNFCAGSALTLTTGIWGEIMRKVGQILLAGTVVSALVSPVAIGLAKAEPEVKLAQANAPPLTEEQQKRQQQQQQQRPPAPPPRGGRPPPRPPPRRPPPPRRRPPPQAPAQTQPPPRVPPQAPAQTQPPPRVPPQAPAQTQPPPRVPPQAPAQTQPPPHVPP